MNKIKCLCIPHTAQYISSGFEFNLKKLVLVTAPLGIGILQLNPIIWRSKIIFLASHISEALNSLHSHGWIHNDVSPSNIIYSFGSFFLIDFESATRIDDQSDEFHSVFFSREFCSTHRILGHRPSFADDWESLIYTLYYIDFRNLPWVGPTMLFFSNWFDCQSRKSLLYNLSQNPPVWIRKCPDLKKQLQNLAEH
jgi:serine/threonine protein kinase